MTVVSIVVDKVWPSHWGGAVFSGRDANGILHRVLAKQDIVGCLPRVGESWRVAGPEKLHPKHGPQIEAALALPVTPEGEHLRCFLAANKAFKGIGEVRAKKLWDHFGASLVAILDAKDITQLSSVLKTEVADNLIRAWEESRSEARLAEWLDHHRLHTRLAAKVAKFWGALAIQKIQENPYRLLAIARWEEVDAAARLIGVSATASVRQIAAVEAVCYSYIAEKHTVIAEARLLQGVRELLGTSQDGAARALELAKEDRAILQLAEGRIQALGPYVMENYLQTRLAKMAAAEHSPSGDLFWTPPSDADIAKLLAEFQASSSLKLTEEQKQAVWVALSQRVGMILGGAGTGKTTVLKAVIWTTEKHHGTVHPLALAGRAAIRITETTGHPARTIAGFMGAIERHELDLGGGDLIVIDEASMVDLPLAYSLMRNIPVDARLLLVGDPYQLPPIGMGLVFSVYAEDDRLPKVELTQVHRQAAETGIPQVAAMIRRGMLPALNKYAVDGNTAQAGISFIPCASSEAQSIVIEVVADLGGPSEVQILSPIKNGPVGISAINAALHCLRATGKDQWKGYAVDAPVIWLENDYERRIWNGTLGVVEAAGPTSLSVRWDGHDLAMTMGLADLESMDLAYAISVHKGQGSQFRRVIVPIFKSRILDRTLIYTALTRATEQVVIIGDLVALKKAVEAPPAPRRRNHGLSVAAGEPTI